MATLPEAEGFKILVVDDNEMNRDMLSRRLQRKGFDVDIADDGQQALDMLGIDKGDARAGGYGLVLLDIMMPGIDGIEVLRRVRDRHSETSLPIIMATAKDTSDDVVEALKLGANDYVTKPLDFPVVLARVQTQMKLKAAHDELARTNTFIKKIFGRYVTDDVVKNLLETEQGLKFGGERRQVTVLMSDVRGFSSLCERLDPEQVVEMLNIYLGSMAEVISSFHNTIDEFIGDAILAIFGAPFDLPDHQEKAVGCAVAMQQAMDGVNTLLNERGLPVLEMGIGLNTGEVVVGNIGSDRRAKYGVVGSHVNLTARIESYTVGGQVLIGQSTAAGIEDKLNVRRSFQVEAKGVEGPFTILDVGGIDRLQLPDDNDSERALTAPVGVNFVLLEGKHIAGERLPGTFETLTHKGAWMRASAEMPVLSNVRLGLNDAANAGDIYAKVLESQDDGRVLIRFTSMSPECRAHLDSLLAR